MEVYIYATRILFRCIIYVEDAYNAIPDIFFQITHVYFFSYKNTVFLIFSERDFLLKNSKVKNLFKLQ